MNCKRCGAKIEEGSIYCAKCGKAIQIVPDYNPWDDVLDENVRKAAGREDEPSGESVRVSERKKAGRTAKPRNGGVKPKKWSRKKRIALYGGILALMLAGLIVFLVSYSNSHSYSHQMKKAEKYYGADDYKSAIKYYGNAVKLDEKSVEARLGYAKCAFALGKDSEAQDALLAALAAEPDNGEANGLLIDYYEAEGRTEDITALLEKCENPAVLEKYSGYISNRPEFSIEEGVYEEEQTVEIRADAGSTVYYTLDGSEPTEKSKRYEKPVELKEGATKLRAVAVTGKGVVSLIASAEYRIELAIPDAPDIQPNTGTYTEGAEITVTVPGGCSVYYTMDGSDPTTGSRKYNGPIAMKEGEYIFSAMAVGENGKQSDVTRRSYSVQPREE